MASGRGEKENREKKTCLRKPNASSTHSALSESHLFDEHCAGRASWETTVMMTMTGPPMASGVRGGDNVSVKKKGERFEIRMETRKVFLSKCLEQNARRQKTTLMA